MGLIQRSPDDFRACVNRVEFPRGVKRMATAVFAVRAGANKSGLGHFLGELTDGRVCQLQLFRSFHNRHTPITSLCDQGEQGEPRRVEIDALAFVNAGDVPKQPLAEPLQSAAQCDSPQRPDVIANLCLRVRHDGL